MTRHSIPISGKPVAYTASAGWMTFNKPDEQPGARMYYTAYAMDGVRDQDAVGETHEDDPASQAIQGAFSTMLNHYLRTELQVKEDLPYAIYGNVYPWNFMSSPEDTESGMMPGGGRGLMTGTNVAETLRGAMTENPSLQVFVANGYYGGATPFFGTAYTFSQMGFNGEFADRIHMGFYEAGHMMYIRKPSLLKLKADLADFIRSASGK